MEIALWSVCTTLVVTVACMVALLRPALVRRTAIAHVPQAGLPSGFGSVDGPRFVNAFQAMCGTRLTAGNRVELVQNGEVFPSLFHDFEEARVRIVFQVFCMRSGELSRQLRAALCAAAGRGVDVRVLIDPVGAKALEDDWADDVRRAGVRVAHFRPIRWRQLGRWQRRTHARAVVVDGRYAHTGGFCIDDRWRGDGRHADQWRDVNVRVEGPAVVDIEATFSANWAEATGELLVGEGSFSGEPAREPNVALAGAFYAAPDPGSTVAERAVVTALSAARRRVFLMTGYLLPPANLRRVLLETAARGVDVRILTPGANSDRRIAWWGERSLASELCGGGIRLYRYRPGMMHAKALVVDGRFAMVGTINIDNHSMSMNDENAVVVQDAAFAQTLERSFLADLDLADEVHAETLHARSAVTRMQDHVAAWLLPFL